MLKKFSTYTVKKIYKMECLEGSGVPVLYIGSTVPKGPRHEARMNQTWLPLTGELSVAL
jgi:hypothetical protein